MSRARLVPCAVALALFVLVLAVQVHRGAFTSDFASHPDEPAHLVTGLMVRDWIAHPEPLHPIRYAEQYYRHYPKVAIGQWPPVFYALQAAWTLPFGASPTSLLALMAFLAACTGALLFASLRAALGTPLAGVCALLFLLMPLAQVYAGRVMTEMPLALFCLAAAVSFGRFLDQDRARDALGFGFWSLAAILVKGNALALALLPPVAILLRGRHDLLRRPVLWLVAALIGGVCAPWYALTLPIARGTWSGGSSPSLDYLQRAASFYAPALVGLLGVALTTCASIGLLCALRAARTSGLWAALVALFASVLALHLALPSSLSERHLMLLAPAWLAFVGFGASCLARRLASGHAHEARAGLAVVLIALFALERFESPPKDVHGYGNAARELCARGELSGAALLIASDSYGEGGFVAAVALEDERPDHWVLRGSKTLAREDWLGSVYAARFERAPELGAWLAQVPVAVLLIDRSVERRHWRAHHDLLAKLVHEQPERWIPIGSWDVMRAGVRHAAALSAYRQAGVRPGGTPRVSLDEALGRDRPGSMD